MPYRSPFNRWDNVSKIFCCVLIFFLTNKLLRSQKIKTIEEETGNKGTPPYTTTQTTSNPQEEVQTKVVQDMDKITTRKDQKVIVSDLFSFNFPKNLCIVTVDSG